MVSRVLMMPVGKPWRASPTQTRAAKRMGRRRGRYRRPVWVTSNGCVGGGYLCASATPGDEHLRYLSLLVCVGLQWTVDRD